MFLTKPNSQKFFIDGKEVTTRNDLPLYAGVPASNIPTPNITGINTPLILFSLPFELPVTHPLSRVPTHAPSHPPPTDPHGTAVFRPDLRQFFFVAQGGYHYYDIVRVASVTVAFAVSIPPGSTLAQVTRAS